MKDIKNIIFDLGGVLIDLDFNRVFASFKALGVENIKEMYGQHHAAKLFRDFESGFISEEEFRKGLRKYIPGQVSDEQIDNAWDSLILEFRLESLLALDKLAERYDLYLFSNTSSIHHRYFSSKYPKEAGKRRLEEHFTKTWYSHLIGKRKPDPESFEYILKDAGIDPKETYFIDDTSENVEAAMKFGIQSKLLLKEERIEDLFI
jgi:putative hydrolase of the HAD superfamily